MMTAVIIGVHVNANSVFCSLNGIKQQLLWMTQVKQVYGKRSHQGLNDLCVCLCVWPLSLSYVCLLVCVVGRGLNDSLQYPEDHLE